MNTRQSVTTKVIESPKNQLIKELAKLKDRRTREQEQRYLIEGCKELSRAVDAELKLELVLYCPKLINAEAELLLQEFEGKLELTQVSKEAFEKISMRQNPDGLVALAIMQDKRLIDLDLAKNALILIVDGLEKPGNIGALLRTADAVNVDAVFLTGEGTDLYNPNVIRSSVGSVFSRPVLRVKTLELMAFLQTHNIRLIATSPEAQKTFWAESYLGATAIILGAEHEGLSQDWFDAANARVTIPMHGLTDSLNVATSGALLLYEALRQRSLIS